MMGYKAVFIGGLFDMTQKILNHPLNEFFFYAPHYLEKYACSGRQDEIVECKKIRYVLCAKTINGVLIYEVQS